MSVDESNDHDHTGPSIAIAADPSPTLANRRTFHAPQQAINDACEDLQHFFSNRRNDDRFRANLDYMWLIVRSALLHDLTLVGKLADNKEFLANVKRNGEGEFIDLMKRTANDGSWEDLLGHDVFFKRPIASAEPDISPESMNATVQAWNSAFKGDAASVLLLTISDYLARDRRIYSRDSHIVNSSGTGKSRMVDELAREVITIPMCLREDDTQGFPPPDQELRGWLLLLVGRTDQTQKLYDFIASLLTVTHQKLQEIESELDDIPSSPTSTDLVRKRQGMLARAFRDRMTRGQSFKVSNDYRNFFYQEVIKLANEPTTVGTHVRESGEKLCLFIDPHRVLDSRKGPRRPLVVLAFDESQVLTDTSKNSGRILFFELRRTLRELVYLAIFSLFLSTAGIFLPRPSPSEIRSDPSTRVAKVDLVLLDPILEISFDDLAFPVEENTVTLDRVVQIDWICHFGRPLFGSHYDGLPMHRNEDAILQFAKTKLVDNKSKLADAGSPGSLACLSVRFPLEFNADESAPGVALKQVERHMRLCLGVTAELENLVTLAGSEPLLAEAAFDLMRLEGNPVRHLANHPDLHCIDRGRQGELVAALIVMQARDAAVVEQRRLVSVSDFMEALLPRSRFQTLRTSMPRYWREGQRAEFQDIFKDYGMWFSHVIKVETGNMIEAENLWKFITRGAMVMCTVTGIGVDIVLPACLRHANLSRDSVTAILIQVRNAEEFQCSIDERLFDAMSPLQIGLFSQAEQSRPVIRIVFALASEKAGVLFPDPLEREDDHADEFTSFDIWCAGLSADTFRFIGDDLAPYKKLLDRSLRPHDAFEFKDAGLDKETKAARGNQRRRMAVLTTDDSGADD